MLQLDIHLIQNIALVNSIVPRFCLHKWLGQSLGWVSGKFKRYRVNERSIKVRCSVLLTRETAIDDPCQWPAPPRRLVDHQDDDAAGAAGHQSWQNGATNDLKMRFLVLWFFKWRRLITEVFLTTVGCIRNAKIFVIFLFAKHRQNRCSYSQFLPCINEYVLACAESMKVRHPYYVWECTHRDVWYLSFLRSVNIITLFASCLSLPLSLTFPIFVPLSHSYKIICILFCC